MFTPPARRIDKMAFGKPTHYYEDANGKRIPGVTTILGDGLPKKALGVRVRWACVAPMVKPAQATGPWAG